MTAQPGTGPSPELSSAGTWGEQPAPDLTPKTDGGSFMVARKGKCLRLNKCSKRGKEKEQEKEKKEKESGRGREGCVQSDRGGCKTPALAQEP